MASLRKVTDLLRRLRPRSTWRMWLHGAIGAVVVILVVESFVTLGLVVPVRVAGSSMSPTFEGAHAAIDCPRCNWQFDVGLDQLPEGRPLLCPDCRAEFPLPEEIDHLPGERLVIDRRRHTGHDPRRWEVVVLRSPEQEGDLCVKRIVGLPGERMTFRDGDLCVDGKLVRKSLDEQLALRQLIHRERESHRCWQPTDGGWRWGEDGWETARPAGGVLSFVPAAGAPLTDDLATNQRATRRPHLVADVMITCRVTPMGDSSFATSFAWDDQVTYAKTIESKAGDGSFDLVVSLFDQQLLVAVDGEVIEQQDSHQPWPGTPTMQLHAGGLVKLTDLEVWRDIHYYTRPGDELPAKGLPAEHYFVVGDNVAISADSRNWPGAGVPLKNLVGGIVGY